MLRVDSRTNLCLALYRLAQCVALAPYGLDVVLPIRSVGELLAQPTDEDFDNLELGLPSIAVRLMGLLCPPL
jgi:hypothetical protein